MRNWYGSDGIREWDANVITQWCNCTFIFFIFFWDSEIWHRFFLSSRGHDDAAVVTASHFIPVIFNFIFIKKKTKNKIYAFLCCFYSPGIGKTRNSVVLWGLKPTRHPRQKHVYSTRVPLSLCSPLSYLPPQIWGSWAPNPPVSLIVSNRHIQLLSQFRH